MVSPGTIVTLEIEKPAAGGRMIGRHGGMVVLVSGAIPGERVRAVVERVGRGVAYAVTEEVITASPDRRPARDEWACGGNLFSHVAYPRQLTLKGEIIADAFARIGHIAPPQPIEVAPSVETGYRMRARLHVQNGRVGFYREGTHRLCDARATGQLLPETMDVVDRWWAVAADKFGDATALELTENLPATERVVHVEWASGPGTITADGVPAIEGMTGVSCARPEWREPVVRGKGSVTDEFELTDGRMGPGSWSATVRLQRGARSFFQGNRYLLVDLIRAVLAEVPPGPVVDLYAGVGLFGISAAACGMGRVVAVEGDRASGADLQFNAQPYADRVKPVLMPVETYLRQGISGAGNATFIVDPPRTGLSREAVERIVAAGPRRILYVSCDVATLARDLRVLIDGGFELKSVRGFDLFPNTAHIETVATVRRR